MVVIQAVPGGKIVVVVPAGDEARGGIMPPPPAEPPRMNPAGRWLAVIVAVDDTAEATAALPVGGVGARMGAVMTVPRGPRLVTVVGPPRCAKLLGVGERVTVMEVCDMGRTVEGSAVIWVRTLPLLSTVCAKRCANKGYIVYVRKEYTKHARYFLYIYNNTIHSLGARAR